MLTKITEQEGSTQKSPEAIELEALKEELLLFASLINHDFKEPIRTISSFSTILGKRLVDEDEKGKELVGFIQDGAGRMAQMVEGLVEYLRIDRYMDAKSPVDLNTILSEVEYVFSKKIKATQALVFSDNLPTVFAAHNGVHALFKHILSNTLEFRNADISPIINIHCVESPTEWTICISDNGIGVPKHLTNQIFQPFRRLNAIGTYKGCGLGLASCKKIMDLHQGKIWAESKEKEGLRLYISFSKQL